MEEYRKPALTFDEQIGLLKSRGLDIPDVERARRHLSNVSYYRLSAYMLPFKKRGEDGKPIDEFLEGTTWDDVYDLYKFDRKLRLLFFDAIERIEVALRTQEVYQLSLKYGSHWQDDRSVFKEDRNGFSYFGCISYSIQNALRDNKNVVFIKHYREKYCSPINPPSWMCLELLYFRDLSIIYRDLAKRSDRLSLSKAFGVRNDRVFSSWLHTINYVRNVCAHHARLWNITLNITPSKFYNYNRSDKVWLSGREVDMAQRSKIYYFICILLFLLQTVNPKTKFRQHFMDLLKNYPNVDVGFMGFPIGWEDHPLWKMQ
ncbi:MAG: Abi family protein [Bacteroidales bacterium]|jgi:abortive infection bacteriophage resistance protein|nr:Abi family protein [Bacteroidales bacterium]MCI2146349.1 Abi family protein [Bacteroidales bacterium]